MPSLKLYWDSVPGAISYTVFWANSPGVTTTNGVPISGITNVVFHHTNLLENTTYYYIVVAVDGGGNLGAASIEFSAASSEITAFFITPDNANIGTNTNQQYASFVTYSDGYSQDVTLNTLWDTDNHALATVDNSGLATGVSVGTVNIQGTYLTFNASVPLIVSHTLVSMDISPLNATILALSQQQFTATGHYNDLTSGDITTQVTWNSTDPTAATISNTGGSEGLATAGGGGSTTISAALGLINAHTTLSITPVLQSIVVTPSNPSIVYPNTQQFTATGHYSDLSTADLTNAVTWMSGSTSVATINGTGLASSVLHGSSLISATLGLITGSTTLTVTNTLVSIAITPTAPFLFFLADTQQFTAIGTYNDTSTADITTSVTWHSATTATATIGASSGLATAVAAGTTAITATLSAITSNTATLTVALWAQQTSNTSNDLTGVWGFSKTNIYAVGKNATILHWDGSSWASQSNPSTGNFLGVQGPDAGHVYAWDDTNHIFVTHNNGVTWTQKNAATGIGLHGFFANSATDAWISGNGTRIVWSGDEFSTIGIDDGNILQGNSTNPVYGFGPNDMFAFGSAANGVATTPVATYTSGAKRGTSWTNTSALATIQGFDILAAWGTSHNDLWVVGGFFDGPGAIHTTDNFATCSIWTTSTFNGGHSTTGSLPANLNALDGVSGSGSLGLVYATATTGLSNPFRVLAYHNGSWVTDFSGSFSGALARAIWTDETTGYSVVVGDKGTILEKGTVPVLQSVAVAPAFTSRYYIGDTKQFIATAFYSNYFFVDVTSSSTWASSDTNSATIGVSTGLATVVGTQGPTQQSVPNTPVAVGINIYGNASNNIYALFQANSGSPVYHSTGNGTWTQTSAWPGVDTDGSLTSNIWVDSTGRIYVSYANGNGNGALQISTNGGSSWTTATINGLTNQYVNAFGFDDTHVFAAAGTGVFSMNMYTSSDHGATWTARTAINDFVNKIFCVSNTEVYVVTGYGGGGGVWVSTDGINFTEKVLASAFGQANAESVWATSSKVYVGLTGGILISSIDQGNTWINELLPATGTISGIYGSSATDVYVIEFGGEVWHSPGDGTWVRVSRGAASPGTAVWAADNRNVYITATQNILKVGPGVSTNITAVYNSITSNTAIFDTFTLTEAWQVQSSISYNGGDSIAAVSGKSDTDIIMGASGGGGVALIYHWNGSSWSTVVRGSSPAWPGPTTNNPVTGTAIAFDGSVYLAWNIREMVKSSNGTTWTYPTNPVSGGFCHAACAVSSSILWQAGYLSGVAAFRRSIDSGSTWSTITTYNSNITINNFLVLGVNDIWAVGNNSGVGVVWQWNGTTWTQISTWTNISSQSPLHDIYSIWGTSDNNLYLAGDTSFVTTPGYAPIVHSTNQFSTWTAQNTGGIVNAGAHILGSSNFNVIYGTVTNASNFKVFRYEPGISTANVWSDNGAVNNVTGSAQTIWVNNATGRAVAAGEQVVETNNKPY